MTFVWRFRGWLLYLLVKANMWLIIRMIHELKPWLSVINAPFSYVLPIARSPNMADDGEEFVVDKILDKRVRNGKVNSCLRTPPSSWIPGGVLPLLEGLWSRGEHMGAAGKPRLSRADQSFWGQTQAEKRAGSEWAEWGSCIIFDPLITVGEKEASWT